LLAIVRETGVTDLDRLRTLHINVIARDSLIPWERLTPVSPAIGASDQTFAGYGTPEERVRNAAFFARGYHAVVGNPPYIRDKKKREDYRRAWPRSATGKYSLSAPMTERFLLMPLLGGRAGFIVSNNYCKRSFGRGVVETTLRSGQAIDFGLCFGLCQNVNILPATLSSLETVGTKPCGSPANSNCRAKMPSCERKGHASSSSRRHRDRYYRC
jgi:hypothetical protein